MTSRESGLFLLSVLGLLLGRTIHAASAGVRPGFAPRPGPSSRDHLDPAPQAPRFRGAPRGWPQQGLELGRIEGAPEAGRTLQPVETADHKKATQSHPLATPQPPLPPRVAPPVAWGWRGGGLGVARGWLFERRCPAPVAGASRPDLQEKARNLQ